METVARRLRGISIPNKHVYIGEWASDALHPKMDHLVCWLPGALALSDKHDAHGYHIGGKGSGDINVIGKKVRSRGSKRSFDANGFDVKCVIGLRARTIVLLSIIHCATHSRLHVKGRQNNCRRYYTHTIVSLSQSFFLQCTRSQSFHCLDHSVINSRFSAGPQ
jgi:hypothetical protein